MPEPKPYKIRVSRYEDGGESVLIDVKPSDKTGMHWKLEHAGGVYHFTKKEVVKKNIHKIVFPHA